MAARRSKLLSAAVLGAVAAVALLGALAFCGAGAAPVARGRVAQGALPMDAVGAVADASSIVTSLQIQQPAWAANLVLVIVPISILIIIYLQSEKTLQERDAVIGKQRL
ncbi:unnamed protein product [Prorocentrum cordatum]|uniref:Uncharacterized protein n=1 Tax=Prorocentrum cordatum TaxID=2364126 RepID=A0ABN9QV51_9DINO|nr:unnamed protein product [Polarella glacialis]